MVIQAEPNARRDDETPAEAATVAWGKMQLLIRISYVWIKKLGNGCSSNQKWSHRPIGIDSFS
jgi:hypothetical protein